MDSLSFWAHSKSMLQRSIKDFHLGHDMAIGAGLAVATILLQVWWKLIPFQDWESHKWLLIASAVLPFIIVLLLHIAYRLITAPWRVYQDQEREHSSQISKLAAELTNTKGELREHLERHDAPELMLQWQWDSRVPNGPLLPRRDLWLENRSASEDVFNVQAEPAFLTDQIVAHFKTIEVLSHGSTVRMTTRLKQSPVNQPLFVGHDDEFDFVVFGTPGQPKDLPEENYYVDSNQHEHVRVPIYITFRRYSGKGYRSKFFFDMNVTTHEDVVQFVEVRPIKPLS